MWGSRCPTASRRPPSRCFGLPATGAPSTPGAPGSRTSSCHGRADLARWHDRVAGPSSHLMDRVPRLRSMTQTPSAPSGQPDIKPRSRDVTDGLEKAAARGMLRAVGLGDDDFAKPQIGVASSWNEITPCNLSLDRLAKAVKDGVH